MALGEFEQLVLLAVLHLAERAYGVEITHEIERRTGRRVSRSALYVTFDRLEKKDLLVSRLGDASEARGGKLRRYVRVTPAGLRALRESRDLLMDMWRGLESVFESET